MSGDPRGGRGRRGTRGLLPRLTVRATGVVHIGKESNRLEWEAARPALRRLRDERGWRYLAEASGLSERELRYVLNGGRVPPRRSRQRLLRLLRLDDQGKNGRAS